MDASHPFPQKTSVGIQASAEGGSILKAFIVHFHPLIVFGKSRLGVSLVVPVVGYNMIVFVYLH